MIIEKMCCRHIRKALGKELWLIKKSPSNEGL